jgi:SAM-dependent methyltransferase
MSHTWSPATYAANAAFVPALGQSILERLAPRAGERILDLGCGDGALTAKLVEAGASVLGVDASAEMVAAARARGLDAHVADARDLPFDGAFDAVFSNAVLHWVPEAGKVARSVHRALVAGGRFVAEFGGHTNVAAIATAFRAVLRHHGLPVPDLWFYPSADEYRAILEGAGFEVTFVTTFPRPTPLPTGMAGWLATFRGGMFAGLPTEFQQQLIDEIIDLLRPSLCDQSGNWTADYVRLQVEAIRR